MNPPFRLLTLHPWFRPDQIPALEWLNALGGREAPVAGASGASVSAAVIAGLELGHDLTGRPNPLPGPTHVQLLDADVAMIAAVSDALPGLVVEGAVVVVDMTEAGLGAALTPFGREVVAKFVLDLQSCGAQAIWFVTRSTAADACLQGAGVAVLQPKALPPNLSSSGDFAAPSAWRGILEGLGVEQRSPDRDRVG